MVEYTIQTEVFYEAGTIKMVGNINSIQFINRGTASIIINGDTLPANTSVEHNGFPGEINTTNYSINRGSVGTFVLTVNKKIYK